MDKDIQNLNRYEDVLGQLPMLQSYTHLLYTFSYPDHVPREDITTQLARAVTEIREQVPWMGGKVVNYGKTEKCSEHIESSRALLRREP